MAKNLKLEMTRALRRKRATSTTSGLFAEADRYGRGCPTTLIQALELVEAQGYAGHDFGRSFFFWRCLWCAWYSMTYPTKVDADAARPEHVCHSNWWSSESQSEEVSS